MLLPVLPTDTCEVSTGRMQTAEFRPEDSKWCIKEQSGERRSPRVMLDLGTGVPSDFLHVILSKQPSSVQINNIYCVAYRGQVLDNSVWGREPSEKDCPGLVWPPRTRLSPLKSQPCPPRLNPEDPATLQGQLPKALAAQGSTTYHRLECFPSSVG